MRKLCVFSFSFALAVFCCQYFLPLKFMPAAAGAAMALGALGAAIFRGKGKLFAIIAGVGLAAGFLWDFGYDTLVFSEALKMDGGERTFTATAADFPVKTDYGAYVDIKIDAPRGPALKARAYFFDEAADSLRPGDRVRMTADLSRADRVGEREITGYTSKGYFLFASDARELEMLSSPGMGVTNFHRYLSKAIRDKVREIFPLGTADFMLALLTGDRSGIDGDVALSASMERAGVSHIVAISGLHVSILAGFMMTVLGRRRWAALATLPVLAVFAAIPGFGASVIRAAVMQAAVLTAPIFMRESDSLTSLSLALLLILLVNPYAIAGVGMQLSFAATLGIILFTPRLNAFLTGRLPKEKKLWVRAARWALGAAATTLGALALTSPISAYYFGCVSIVGPLANLAVLWAVSPAFVLGALAVGAGFVWLPLGRALAYPPAVLVRYVIWAVKALAKPYLAAVYLDGTAVTVWFAATYFGVVALAVLRPAGRWFLRLGCVSAAALCGIAVLTDVISGAGEGYSLTCLDVGQGQSIVVVSGEYTAVIDCGTSGWQDAGEITERYVRGLGRGRIDLLVLTHYHSDHVNGVERLLRTVDVGLLCVPEPRFTESDLDEEVLAAAGDAGCEIRFVEDLTTVELGGSYVTLYPPLGDETENERGLMAMVGSGDFETVITGDAPGYLERELLGKYELPDVECLVVGHHGSKTSTTEAALDALRPETAIISVGENSYGHPTGEVLGRLESRGIEIFRTDECGNVTVRSR